MLPQSSVVLSGWDKFDPVTDKFFILAVPEFQPQSRPYCLFVQRGRGKNAKKPQQLTTDDLLGSNTRDMTLSIFRALGKILYNKRQLPGSTEVAESSAGDDELMRQSSERGMQALLGRIDSTGRLPVAERYVQMQDIKGSQAILWVVS